MLRLSDLCNVRGWNRENDHYWREVGMQAVDINYYKLSEICHYTKIEAFVTSCFMRAVERGYLRPLAGRHFYRLCLRGLCYPDKDASGASRDFGAVNQASTRPSASVDTFVQLVLRHRIRTIVQPEDSHMQYQRNHCYIVPVVTYPRINPYVDILIWSYP